MNSMKGLPIRRTIIILMTLIAGAVSVLFLVSRRDTASNASRSSNDEVPEARYSPEGESYPSSLLRVDLPPKETPLRETLRQLKDSALKGDRAAACRLALDIKRCNSRSDILSVAEDLARFPSPPGVASSLPEQLIEQTDADNKFCTGVAAKELDSGYLYQTIAANSGDKNMIRWLIYSPAMRSDDYLEDLDLWQDYRRRAEKYTRLALSARNGEDLHLLLLMYAPKNVRIARPPYRVDDYETFLALMQVAKRHQMAVPMKLLEEAENIRSSLSREEMLRVDERTAELVSNWIFREAKTPAYYEYSEMSLASGCLS